MNSILVIVIFIGLYAWDKTRKFAGYMLPWFLFGLCYDLMRYYPNYKVNAIDVRSLYEAERSLFGITTATGRIIPGEWFSLHTCAVADLLSGIFYLCWVPVPILFSIWLYATRRCHSVFPGAAVSMSRRAIPRARMLAPAWIRRLTR